MRALTKPQMSALGERFREAREARGLTLSDVAEQIRIRSVYLAAIEDENWGAIGAPVYIRGFLRTYGRYLGLNPEDGVAEFNQRFAAEAASGGAGESAAAYRPPARPLSPMVWVAGAVAVILVGLVIYSYLGIAKKSPAVANGTASTPVPSPDRAGASPSPASPRPSPAVKTNALAIRFDSGSWVRVTVDGSVRVEGTFPKGTSKTFAGKSALVRAGNAAAIDVTVDGKHLGRLGAVGEVVERSFTL